MPRAVRDFSPIYTTEQVPLGFDFSPGLASGETISSPVVSAVVVLGIDATPSARLIGSPVIFGTFVLQFVGTLQPGAIYDLIVTVATSGGQILTTNAHQPCASIG